MELQKLTLHNFKNIGEAELELSPKVNCFLGNNGMGKSNLLDAIYTLSFCRSYMGGIDRMLIKRDEPFMMVKGIYRRGVSTEELTLGMTDGQRKKLKRGDKEYGRLSNHIGKFPLVMAAPQDAVLINGTSEERRRWMDMVISQSDANYLDSLIRYNRLLEQRNRLLRDGISDPLLFESVETGMDMAAQVIARCRQKWVERLLSIFSRHYQSIAGSREMPGLELSSRMVETGMSLQRLLDEVRRKDEIVKHTSVGPHRDDIVMTLEGMPMKRTGSQGQCKSYTVALRFAQFEFLRESSGLTPLLLLDDIFDKLDARRVENIMERVTSSDFGQIFITDTNRKHLDEIVERIGVSNFKLWNVDNGNFTPIIAE
ncbi:MAG: DNA replication and repair protein RecF [Muribaculaceae bacterium]|nr:DNA replication and repair protein RecF [Muribaculaceae bacterium]